MRTTSSYFFGAGAELELDEAGAELGAGGAGIIGAAVPVLLEFD